MSRLSLLLFALPLAIPAAPVTLASSRASAPLGTLVTFTASVGGAAAEEYSYRFRVHRPIALTTRHLSGIGTRTIVDYGPKASLDWTTIESEGRYEVEVSARSNNTGEESSDSVMVEFSRLAGDGPVVTPTQNPLVFVYSAPPCAVGARMLVRFAPADGSGLAQQTPPMDCDASSTMNVYLAGMRAGTAYTAWQTIDTGGAFLDGPQVRFATGVPTITLPTITPLGTPVSDTGAILLHSVTNARPIATDLNGNLLWYGPSGLALITRLMPGGNMIGVVEDGSKGPAAQTFREFDLAGVTVAETNAAQVNRQLAAAGARQITSFHHEGYRLPDGQYLLLAGSEQLMDGVQGSGSADVLGDSILVLDRDLQVVWYWDGFRHLDPARAAILNETCSYPASLACSTFYGAGSANDWLHGNSLQITPDGNILYSARHQDWVIKIDYRGGAGTGDILWRLGAGGDFTLAAGDAGFWFSHQHDAKLMPDGATLLLFDNGNTRIAHNNDQGTSRGQVWRIDEDARVATLSYSADMQVNSAALGSAQILDNGNYHFEAGFFPDPGNSLARISRAIETDPGGNIVWGMQMNAQVYRSFRLNDLYTPPYQ
jgi:arylsulfate sulfotransferase